MAQSRPAKTHSCHDQAGPVKPAVFSHVAASQQNRENDQDGDGADVDKDLDQPDKLSAEQEIKRSDTGKCHHQTQGGVDQPPQRCRRQRRRESQNRNSGKGNAVHSANR